MHLVMFCLGICATLAPLMPILELVYLLSPLTNFQLLYLMEIYLTKEYNEKHTITIILSNIKLNSQDNEISPMANSIRGLKLGGLINVQ